MGSSAHEIHHRVMSDDPVVEDLLLGTLDLVREAGGWVASGTRVIAKAGQLSIESDATRGPLMRIPAPLWVRVDRVTWGFDGGRLDVLDVPDDIGEFELPMLYLQTALHNACGKLAWLSATHPSLAGDVPAEVVSATRALIPSFRTHSTDVVDVLFANRCFRIPTTEGAPAERVLIPLIDLLNHHADGSAGTWLGDAFTVDARLPFGTGECALNYGLDRDAIEMAASYGFVDASARTAHSAPVSVRVTGLGVIGVRGDGRAPDGRLLPVASRAEDGVTSLNRVTFSSSDHDGVLRDVRTGTGWDDADARAVLDGVARANADLVDALIRACDAAPQTHSAAVLREAARTQRRHLEVFI